MPPLARSTSRPTFGKPANKFLSRGCFGSNGEVWCFCNTEPRVEALRRVTRKESSPNLGREFYSCGNWQEPKCEFFLWVDESAQKGRQNVTPPPADGAPIARPRPTTPAAPSSSSRVSPLKRARSPALLPSSSHASAAPPSSSKRPLPASERLDDIDFDSFELSEDDIQDADTEPEPDTLEDTQDGTRTREESPTKKPKFTSFSSGGGGGGGGNDVLKTPTKAATTPATRGGGGGYAAIKNDPESPFHSIRRNLFGGDSSPPPSSSPLAPPPPKANATISNPPEQVDSLETLTTYLDQLPQFVLAVKKDRERDQRLIQAGKKKEELWRGQHGKLEVERDRLKTENEGLKEKVRRLEEEVRELRMRR